MITFADVVMFAAERDPATRVQNSASAFLAMSGFTGLIVTAASPKTAVHQVLFSQGYPSDCVEHVRSSYCLLYTSRCV